MTDNLPVTPGGGASVRSKDTGGNKHIQYLYVATGEASVINCQQATIGTTAGTLASVLSGTAIPSGATHALVQADSTNTGVVRWRDDGTNPTSAVGLEIAAGNAVEWINLTGVRIIGTAASQKLNISFRRYDQ